MGRISIAGILGAVAALAGGLAALIKATDAWAGATFTLTVGLLFASLLGVILRGWRRGGWLGFAVFGWGYFLLGNVPGLGFYQYQRMLPNVVAEWIFLRSNPRPVPPFPPTSPPSGAPGSVLTPAESAYFAAANIHKGLSANAGLIAYDLSVLFFAEVGAILGVVLARGQRSSSVPNE